MNTTKKVGKNEQPIDSRISRRKQQKELKRKAILKARRPAQKSTTNNKKGYEKPERKRIHLPKVFDLYDNHEDVMEKINTFREYFDDSSIKRHVHIDCRKIEEITIASALVLAADIDAWRITMRPASVKLPQKIIDLFDELGFFELLGIPRDSNGNIQRKNISFVRFLSAQKASGEKAVELRKRIEETMEQELQLDQRQALFHSLTEALANAAEHAYDPTNLKKHEMWWITAACSSGPDTDKELRVVIYDRGMTIPTTMVKTWYNLSEIVPKAMRSDAKLIRVAMESSYLGKRHRSQTKEKHRGKGLAQLLDMVRLENGGKVHIISGRGHCCFGVEKDKLVTYCEENLKFSMHGTLIEWRIWL